MSPERINEPNQDRLKSEKPFSCIAVAVDGSESSFRAAKYAARLAKRYESKLLIVSVIQKPVHAFIRTPIERSSASRMEHYYEYASKNAEEWNRKVAALARSIGVNAESRVLKDASIVKAITEYGLKQKVDLIVVGRKGTSGFKRLLLGSVSTGIVNHAASTVLVVK